MSRTTTRAIDYQHDTTARERELESYVFSLDLRRDVVLPAALFGVGAAMIVLPLVASRLLTTTQILAISAVLFAVCALKWVVLLGLAFAFAWMFDLSFGRLSWASFKIAALVVFFSGVPRALAVRYPDNWMLFIQLMIMLGTAGVYLFGVPYLFGMTLVESRTILIVLTVLYMAIYGVLAMNFSHIVVHVAGARIMLFSSRL